MGVLQHFQGLIGLAAIIAIAFALSENRALRPSWRWVAGLHTVGKTYLARADGDGRAPR